MNDDRLNHYRQVNTTDNQKALEFTKQDEQFKSDIASLKSNQDRLDGKCDKLNDELRRNPAETESEKNDYEKLREEYDKTTIEADANREALKQKEKEYEDFKEQNKQNLGQEATEKDVNQTYDEQTFGEEGANAGLAANRYRSQSSDDLAQSDAAGDASQGSQPTNDPRLDQTRQKAIDQAKEVGKDLAQKQKEQQPEKDQDDDR